jgi:hypothetical protein
MLKNWVVSNPYLIRGQVWDEADERVTADQEDAAGSWLVDKDVTMVYGRVAAIVGARSLLVIPVFGDAA